MNATIELRAEDFPEFPTQLPAAIALADCRRQAAALADVTRPVLRPFVAAALREGQHDGFLHLLADALHPGAAAPDVLALLTHARTARDDPDDTARRAAQHALDVHPLGGYASVAPALHWRHA